MAQYTKQLHFLRNGTQNDITLYTSLSDVVDASLINTDGTTGGITLYTSTSDVEYPYLRLMDGDTPVYAALELLTSSNTSESGLKVSGGGNTYVVKKKALPAKGKSPYTPAEIKKILNAGKHTDYFNVGDSILTITLNGTIEGKTFTNQTIKAKILGFDHNKATETKGKSSITFGIADITGADIVLMYGDNWLGAKMDLSSTNSGGWNGSYMRSTVCNAFYNALPYNLKAVIGSVTKYSDNTGGVGNTASHVTATTDKIFLLSEYEVFKTKKYANIAEQNYQQQYDYYKDLGSKIRYRGSYARAWWLRSSCSTDYSCFCFATSDGVPDCQGSDIPDGFAPGFAIVAD